MDGLLIVDKPVGPTSHDVVARARRRLGERRIGHTGTLDPAATGLLVLVFGRATKLAALLTSGDKTYEAVVRFGIRTTTDDGEGTPIGSPSANLPTESDVMTTLDAFRGVFDQTPPAHSAKKVGGAKAYDLARRDKPVALKPVQVSVRALERLEYQAGILQLRVTAASGFYVRALARDLGDRLGCGAHLSALRRTASGPFHLADALSLETAEARGGSIEAALVAPADALPQLAAVSVTESGLRRAIHGNALSPDHLVRPLGPREAGAGPVKVLAPDGRLVALAHLRGGVLHPMAVLG